MPDTPDRAGRRLAEIRARHEAATKGPWFSVGPPWNHDTPFVVAGVEDPHFGTFIADMVSIGDPPAPTEAEQWANAALIAASRTDVPVLLDAVEAALRVGGPEIREAVSRALDDDMEVGRG